MTPEESVRPIIVTNRELYDGFQELKAEMIRFKAWFTLLALIGAPVVTYFVNTMMGVK